MSYHQVAATPERVRTGTDFESTVASLVRRTISKVAGPSGAQRPHRRRRPGVLHCGRGDGAGIVSKRVDSCYRSGRTDRWRKVKCWTESSLVLIGTEVDKRSGVPMALLARQDEEGLR